MITLQQLVTLLGGVLLHEGQTTEFESITLVTRISAAKSLKENTVVVTARPERWGKFFDDSSDHLQQFSELGAGVIIVDKEPESSAEFLSASVILVPDTRAVLRKLAHFQRLRSAASVTVITGSAGKTTTKEMLASATEKSLKTFKSPFTSNTSLEVFVNIVNTPLDTQHAIYEIGIEGPDSIWGKSIATRPDCAIITSIGPAHLGRFADMKHLAATKAEIFYGLVPGGSLIINDQSEEFEFVLNLARMRGDLNITTYGLSPESNLFIESVSRNQDSSIVTASIFGSPVQLKVPPFRPHLELNALAVIARGHQLGIPLDLTLQAIEDFSPLDGRSSIFSLRADGAKFKLIDDSFNANLISIKAALRTLQLLNASKRIAVIGEMAELGKFSDEAHEQLARLIEQYDVDHLICIGDGMRPVARSCEEFLAAEYHETLDSIAERVLQLVTDDSAVLIKGSNSNRLSRVVQMVRKSCQTDDTNSDTKEC